MTDLEITTTGRTHAAYIHHGGTTHDPYNAPFGFDDLLKIASTFDRTGRRYHISAIRYVLSLLVEIRTLRARVEEMEVEKHCSL